MKGHAFQVILLGFVLTTACNKEEYFGTSVAIEGQDAHCSAGTDVASCEVIQGCQVAYEDVESVDPIFAACIANPPEVVASDPDPADDPEGGSSAGSSGGASAGSSGGSNSGSSDSNDDDSDEVPTVSDAYYSGCKDLPEEYYYSKNYSGKGQSHRVKKVKVCHQENKGEHAIIVACPSLKGHLPHKDYLGACK